MAIFFLAIEEGLCERMFVPGEAMHIFVPGFFSNGVIPFKDSRDLALCDALRRPTPMAQLAPYYDTMWCILYFILDYEAVAWLISTGDINMTSDGYDVMCTASVSAWEEWVNWPRMTEPRWLVNFGYPACTSLAITQTCTLCNVHNATLSEMYEVDDGLICHACLLRQQLSRRPLLS